LKTLFFFFFYERGTRKKKNVSIGRTFKSLHDEKEDDSGEG
jgi:hypothetical protein